MSIHHERYRAQRVRERSFLLLFLFALMMFVVLVGMVLAFYLFPDAYELMSRRVDRTSATPWIEVQIADHSFAIPEHLVARVEKSFLGPAKRVDLKIPVPFDPEADFAVAPAGPADRGWFLLTLEPRQGRSSLEQFYDDIYTVYLTDEIESQDGMTVRRFKPNGPYSDSLLYIDERSGNRAVLRCDLQPSALGPVLCERLIAVGGDVSARLRFNRNELANWQKLENIALAITRKITVPPDN